jgi:hypothetical protein
MDKIKPALKIITWIIFISISSVLTGFLIGSGLTYIIE